MNVKNNSRKFGLGEDALKGKVLKRSKMDETKLRQKAG